MDFVDEPLSETANRNFKRFCKLDSRRWIDFICQKLTAIDFDGMTGSEARFLRMTYETLFGEVPLDWQDQEVQNHLNDLYNSPTYFNELMALIGYQKSKIDFIDHPVAFAEEDDYPLDVYCTYSRNQILLALDFMKPNSLREGVKYLPDLQCDLLFVTLNKSDKDYSPSTMYADYSIDETTFHWQSQNTTSEASKTGQRYIHHREQGSKVALFVRENKKDAYGNTASYTFLGLVDYISHCGERPMNILWHLQDPIPAKFLGKTNQLLMG